ncbi:hypothetical protein, partial [Nonomuraea sp. NPDC050691]|uniref:hypothetical protein n=1 Tax=Nonomuraea sp. NPDC050691 TaxID=3155661 RepID=UPI0033F55CDD
ARRTLTLGTEPPRDRSEAAQRQTQTMTSERWPFRRWPPPLRGSCGVLRMGAGRSTPITHGFAG